MSSELKVGNISKELWRTYTAYNLTGDIIHKTFIDHPVTVFYGKDHYFHRVFNGVVTTLCLAPGLLYYHGKLVGYVEVAWENSDKENPCNW